MIEIFLRADVLRDPIGSVTTVRRRVVDDERRLRVLRAARCCVAESLMTGILASWRIFHDVSMTPFEPMHDRGNVVADHLVRAVARLARVDVVDADVERDRMAGEPVHVVVQPRDRGVRDGLFAGCGAPGARAAVGDQSDLHGRAGRRGLGTEQCRGRLRARCWWSTVRPILPKSSSCHTQPHPTPASSRGRPRPTCVARVSRSNLLSETFTSSPFLAAAPRRTVSRANFNAPRSP